MDERAILEKHFFPYIASPGRFLGNEFFAVKPSETSSLPRIALCFAGGYGESLQHPFFCLLYASGNRRGTQLWERAFCPTLDEGAILRSKNIPLFTLESDRPVRECEAILVYVPDHLALIQAIWLLALCGLPLQRSKRGTEHPPIWALMPPGINPTLLLPIVDVLVTGESLPFVLHVFKDIEGNRTILRGQIPKEWRDSELEYLEPEQENFAPVLRPGEPEPDREEQDKAAPWFQENGGNVSWPPLVSLHGLPPPVRYGEALWRHPGCSDCAAGKTLLNRFPDRVRKATRQLQSWLVEAGYLEFQFYPPGSGWLLGHWWQYLQELVVRTGQPLEIRQGVPFHPAASLHRFVGELQEHPFPLGPLPLSLKSRVYTNRLWREADLLQVLQFTGRRGWYKTQFLLPLGLPADRDEDLQQFGAWLKQQKEKMQGQIGKPLEWKTRLSLWWGLPFTPHQWEAVASFPALQARMERWQKMLQDRGIPCIGENLARSFLAAWASRAETADVEPLLEGIERLLTRSHARESIAPGMEGLFSALLEELDLSRATGLPSCSVTVPLPWEWLLEGQELARLKNEKRRLASFTPHPDCADRICLGQGLPRSRFGVTVQETGVPSRQSVGTPGQEGAFSTPSTHQYGRRARRKQVAAPLVKQMVRLRYAKQGKARFLSLSEVARAFRVAAHLGRISLVYSQGKNPRPRFSFGPGLPIGVASVAEYLDMEVQLGHNQQLESALNARLPDGLQILQSKRLFVRPISLAAAINLWEYEVYFDGQPLSSQQLEAWLARDSVPYLRQSGERQQELDLRPFVVQAELVEDKLILVLRKIEETLARVTEVLESILGDSGIDIKQLFIQRTAQWIQTPQGVRTPFEDSL